VLCVVDGGDVFVCNGHLTEHVFGAQGVCVCSGIVVHSASFGQLTLHLQGQLELRAE